MAYTIDQQPTSPNGTIANLMYVVSSDNTGEDNFRYIADIYYSGGSDYLTRIKFFPNADGSGVFNAGKILNDYIEPEQDEIWKNDHDDESSNPNGNKEFVIKFGEEYGDPVAIYAGEVDSNVLSAFAASVDPNGGSYNFPSASYTNAAGDVRLSNYPYSTSDNDKYTKYIAENDYETISFLNIGTGKINSIIKYGSGGTVTLHSGTLTDTIVTVGVGPANFTTGAPTPSSGDGEYFIDVDFTSGPDNLQYYFKVVEECNYDRVRFAFINKFGMWDYFGVNLPQSKVTALNRKMYQATSVDYSGTNPSYDVNRRGNTQYYTSYTDRFSVTTDWLTTLEADWLTELIESSEPFIQQEVGGTQEFVPIMITNSSYTWKTNPKGQKVFQHTIEWMYSNPRFSR